MARLSGVALDRAGGDPVLLTTKRARARVVCRCSPVMRSQPVWLPDGPGVTPGTSRAAGWGGAQPAHHQRPPRPCRRHPHRTLMPARRGPLPAGCRG